MERGFVFDDEDLTWRCACGRSVEELDFKITYFHNLKVCDNTKRQFQSEDWDITSSLHCRKCGNLYTDGDGYKLDIDDGGYVGIVLEVDGDYPE